MDIYIIFKNPTISNHIYKIYNKSKVIRFFYYFLCQCFKIRKYYYKNQWLNFRLANNSPSDIKWENCYVSKEIKKTKRNISKTISSIIIIITGITYYLLNLINTDSDSYVSIIIICINLGINIGSSALLLKLTNSEKHSTLTKTISSVIIKYFVLNFIISGILININTYFTYRNFEQYHEIIKNILSSMLFSAFTSHISVLISFIWNKLLRFLDSRFENGKRTKIKNKIKYENLYIGEDFILSDRYSKIFVNFYICILYGTYCPLIYLFFTLFLITTFLVDKFLIINYYKRPPYYDIYLSKLTQSFLFFGIFLFCYSTIYQLSNPYLFNFYQNLSNLSISDDKYIYMFVNPFTIIFNILKTDKDIYVYNLSNLYFPYMILLIIFVVLWILIKILDLFLRKLKTESLQNAPRIDIGKIYSIDELKKYYELKKLQFFKLLINLKNCKNKLNDYSHLINNYKCIIDYFKQSIKNKDENKNENTNIVIINEYKNERLISDDASYNLCFIPKYDIYSYFDLLFF